MFAPQRSGAGLDVLFAGEGLARDGVLGGQHAVDGARKGELHRTAHLPQLNSVVLITAPKARMSKKFLHIHWRLSRYRWALCLCLCFDFVIARQGFKGCAGGFRACCAEHEDAVAGDVAAGSRVENIVPDLALQADVGDETLKGLRSNRGLVVGVRVAVRIAVLAIEE